MTGYVKNLDEAMALWAHASYVWTRKFELCDLPLLYVSILTLMWK